jgi:cyanophycin synthetase
MTGILKEALPIDEGDTRLGGPVDADALQVTGVRALRGPNYWRLSPVIACDVRLGSLEDFDTARSVDFCARLLAALPSLENHPCAQQNGVRFPQALARGMTLPHVLAHMTLELQTLAGGEVSFGRVVRSGDPSVWWVIVDYEEEEVGVESVYVASDIIAASLRGESFDTAAIVEDLKGLQEDVRLGPSTWAIVEEARRRGIPVRRLNSSSLVQVGLGRNLRRIQATLTDFTSAIGVEIAQNKDETKRVLRDIGLPVPDGSTFATLEGARAHAEEIGYPVILKPLDASHGRGVSPPLNDAAALETAWALSSVLSPRVIVERFHTGRDHRVLVVGGRVVACAERVPAHVVGDGEHTIRELIEQANRDPRRGKGHRKSLTFLPADQQTEEFLARGNFTFDTVPPAGERVMLRATANLSTGGTSIDRTDEMHAENVAACEMAAGIIGLDVTGLDVLTEDISIPFRDNNAVIIEANAAPGLRMHTHPAEGAPRPVAASILDMLYSAGSETTIPILAVTGTNGKTTTVRLLAHLFRNVGERVGFTTTDGVYVQNRLVMTGDMTGPFGANIILSNPTVSIAVLETARGGLLRSGLGFDECDLGVVLNITADHLGLGGINTVEQLAHLKGVIAAVVRRDGHAVLNADDPLVYALRERTGGDVVLFSAKECGENVHIEEHTRRGGTSACMSNGQFVIRRGRVQIPLAHERDVPLSLGGAARFQRQNVLAASVSAFARGMRYDDIRAGLLSFLPSPSLTPGRMNLMTVPSGAQVIVDYAHNSAAIEALLDTVGQLNAKRRVAVIAISGRSAFTPARGPAQRRAGRQRN